MQQAVLEIAATMHFQASLVTTIGLRIPDELLAVDGVKQLVQVLGLREEPSFPFLEATKTFRHYRKLLVSLDYVEYQYASPLDVGEADEATPSASDAQLAPEQRVLDPIMWKTPERQGWLMRQGKVLSWKHHYMVLQHDMLFCFAATLAEDPSQLPVDSIALPGVSVKRVVKESGRKSPRSSGTMPVVSPSSGGSGRKSPRDFLTSTFSVMPYVLRITEKWGGGSRVVMLACESEEELQEWERDILRGAEKRGGLLNVKKNLEFSHDSDLMQLINTNNPLDLYSNFTSIGKGGFSSVWSAFHRETGQVVVVKVIKIKKLNLKVKKKKKKRKESFARLFHSRNFRSTFYKSSSCTRPACTPTLCPLSTPILWPPRRKFGSFSSTWTVAI